MKLSDFEALSFDCYGTIIDWEQGIWDATLPWRERTGVTTSRDEILEAHGSLEAAAERANPTMTYPRILRLVMQAIGERFGQPATYQEAAHFGDSVGRWPPFPDSLAALTRLKSDHRLIILSNVDRASFAATNAHLGVTFDAIVTAEDVRSYKPDPANFAALLKAAAGLGVAPGKLLHVAQSLYHDHVPAKAVGLATVWIDRRHDQPGVGATPDPRTFVTPDWIFPSLDAFAAACDEARSRG